MHCKYCGFVNGEEDHRCLRCGRRIPGIVIAAPPGYAGANALALAPAADGDTRDFAPYNPATATQDGTRDLTESSGWPRPAAPFVEPPYRPGPYSAARQEPLFSSVPDRAVQNPPSPDNLIPFEQIQRRAGRPVTAPAQLPAQPVLPGRPAAAPRRAQSGPAQQPVQQSLLDFVPASPLKARMLKTEVEAQVFCERPVATPTHRFVAAAIDAAFILIGFGILLLAFHLTGGRFAAGKLFWISLGSALAFVTLAYGLLWTIAGRETAGMAFTDLQLINFDGGPVDARSRAVRFLFTWMSFCAGGLGVLWAVADEENLTWHDHISKTFPTLREAGGAFVKQRR